MIGHPHRVRVGFSLIEVIACTILVSLLMVPIAGVLGESTRAIARVQQGGSVESEARHTLQWVGRTVGDGTFVRIDGNRTLVMQSAAGQTWQFYVDRGGLVRDDGSTRSRLMDNVRDVTFGELRSRDGATILGVQIRLTVWDQADGQARTVTSQIAVM